jgi:prepilin-type N-terminal cleavage/methylation domain-containing protein
MVMRLKNSGFTFIELSIVLIIIGLIAGSIAAGADLVAASGLRATVTQIERYNIAAYSFRTKYENLPGDINAAAATAYGFSPRGPYSGMGDGNGILEGVLANYPNSSGGTVQLAGETAMFWVDLSAANLIPDSFSTASASTPSATAVTLTSSPNLFNYFPRAKIGGGNFITVYSLNSQNYYAISAITSISALGAVTSTPGLTPRQAYYIDAKIDDGLPKNGNVLAQYEWVYSLPYANGNGGAGAGNFGAVNPASTSGTSTTCYDNGGVYNANFQYSVEVVANTTNCGVTIRLK